MSTESDYIYSSMESSSDEEFSFELPKLESCFGILEFIPEEDIRKMKNLKCKLPLEEMTRYEKNERLFNKGKLNEMIIDDFIPERKIFAYDFYNFFLNSCETYEDKIKLRNQFLFLPNLKKRIENPSEITLASADNYDSWIRVCFALKFLFRKNYESLGHELFHSFSKLSNKYDEEECDKLWEKADPEYGSIGHVIKYIKEKKKIPNLNRKELIKKSMKTKFEKEK